MKLIARFLLLIGTSALILYILVVYGLIDFSSLVAAYRERKEWVALCVCTQALALYLMVLRYHALLRIFGLEMNREQVKAATFISSAIGQWMPASPAVIEILRVGLLVGGNRKDVNTLSTGGGLSATSRLASRLTAISLLDRAAGLWGMLLMGAIAATGILILGNQSLEPSSHYLLVAFTGLSWVVVLVAGIAAVVRQKTVAGSLLDRIFELLRRKADCATGIRLVVWKKLHAFFGLLLALYNDWQESREMRAAWLPVAALSLAMAVLTGLSLYFSSVAIGGTISIDAIFIVTPVLAISMFFPIGLGGIGGVQVFAVLLFSAFGVKPTFVASATLLQQALDLIVKAVFGLIYFQMNAAQIRLILAFRSSKASA
jgi:uncharacterized membrane protein YbhN (UPF0104 family)